MQEFEKKFIRWTIAELKNRKKPVAQMIATLKEKNPELGAYAESVEGSTNSWEVLKLRDEFADCMVSVCNQEEDPAGTAAEFFKALGISPNTLILRGLKKS